MPKSRPSIKNTLYYHAVQNGKRLYRNDIISGDKEGSPYAIRFQHVTENGAQIVVSAFGSSSNFIPIDGDEYGVQIIGSHDEPVGW